MLKYMQHGSLCYYERTRQYTTRPSVLLSDLILPARIPSNSSCKNENYKEYNGGRTMKDNNVLNSLKAKVPEKPKGCIILSEMTEKPVRLLYHNARQSSLLVS
jgi:hypothetical protein